MKILRIIPEPQKGSCDHCQEHNIIIRPMIVELDEAELPLDLCKKCSKLFDRL